MVPAAFLIVTLAAAVFAKPTHSIYPKGSTDVKPNASSIKWRKCDDALIAQSTELGVKSKFYCADLIVPLDYMEPGANKTHIVEMVRVPMRSNGTSKGSVLCNFGGPGDGAIETLLGGSELLLNVTGGDYDLVAFRPRGTSAKHLQASCFESSDERASAFSGTSGSILDLLGDSSRSRAGWNNLRVATKALASQCKKGLQDKGEYMGTAYTARDAMAVVDALGEEKLNYYGLSYGTVLGATLAAMFPERMGRIVLDSVANPYDYYEAYAGAADERDLDANFMDLLEACIEAGQEVCPLAKEGKTALEINKKVTKLLASLTENPLIWPEKFINFTLSSAGYSIDGYTLSSMIFNTLYSPRNYHHITTALAGLLNGDAIPALGLRTINNGPDTFMSEANLAISCGDRRVKKDASLEAAQMASAAQPKGTLRQGSLSEIFQGMMCSQWPFSAKEIYKGDFNMDVRKNPFLIMGNKHDPVTPLASARNLTDGFRGSALVEMNYLGHTAMSAPSDCIRRIVTRYFTDGELPKDGTVCELDTTMAEILAVNTQKAKQD